MDAPVFKAIQPEVSIVLIDILYTWKTGFERVCCSLTWFCAPCWLLWKPLTWSYMRFLNISTLSDSSHLYPVFKVGHCGHIQAAYKPQLSVVWDTLTPAIAYETFTCLNRPELTLGTNNDWHTLKHHSLSILVPAFSVFNFGHLCWYKHFNSSFCVVFKKSIIFFSFAFTLLMLYVHWGESGIV